MRGGGWSAFARPAGSRPKAGATFTGTGRCAPSNPASVILVGNGPSVLLRGECGAEIDAFDQVVRFNWFAIRGFERFVGTRTDLWSTFGRGSLPRDEDQRPQRAIYTHGKKPKRFVFPVRETYGIPRPFHDGVRAELQAATTRTGEARAKLLPTSGLTVALWLLRAHGLRELTLFGFDHFSKKESGMHHYWVPSNFKKPAEHDGDLEAVMFAALATQGRVRYLSKAI